MRENPEDIFWGAAAILTLTLAQVFSWLTNWGWWYLCAVRITSICLVKEAQRARLPLSPKQRATRRTSLFIISCLLFVCIVEFIGMFLPK